MVRRLLPQKAGIKKREGRRDPFPSAPVPPTWGLMYWKPSGAVDAAACGQEHPRLLIHPSRKVLCTWSFEMHKQE